MITMHNQFPIHIKVIKIRPCFLMTIKRVFISEQLSYYISIYSLIVLFFSQITDSLAEIRSKITRSKYIPYKNIVIKTNLNIFCQEKWALTIYAHKHYYFLFNCWHVFTYIYQTHLTYSMFGHEVQPAFLKINFFSVFLIILIC